MTNNIRYYRFLGALQPDGWLCPAYVGVDDNGLVSSISQEKPMRGFIENVEGYAIPGFQNAHSHAFQYAMAGLAEIHSVQETPDDFWSWRKAMYNVALQVGPEEMEAIATLLYSEMLRHGYTHVAEFHYVHHDLNGQPYGELAEMGSRLISAARRAGIKITLVPMFYQKGGFGKQPTEGQRRFISSDVDAYHRLLTSSQEAVKQYAGARLGFGFHSLRAVEHSAMEDALSFADDRPIHIHIAEQLKEIDDCKSFYGARPVEWLFDHFSVDQSWHLVHCTHLDTEEVRSIAKSGANAVICPTTEGNLGDGLFRLKEYIDLDGRWSIGTDSHIGLDPKEELRLLDYGQRLTSHKRNTYYNAKNGDSGHFGFFESLLSGSRAMGTDTVPWLLENTPLDAVIIDGRSPLIQASSEDKILSTYIYAGDSSFNLGTVVNGKWVIQKGQHDDQLSITHNFIKALDRLGIRRKK